MRINPSDHKPYATAEELADVLRAASRGGPKPHLDPVVRHADEPGTLRLPRETPRVVPAASQPLADLVALAETVAADAEREFRRAAERLGLVLVGDDSTPATHLAADEFEPVTICDAVAWTVLAADVPVRPCRECAAAVDARDEDERRSL